MNKLARKLLLSGSPSIFAFTVALVIPCAAQQPVDLVVSSANRFIATLSEAQRSKVLYQFNDGAQRARWSNFPTGFVPRGGMSLKQMSAQQKAAALDLMKTVLSHDGYEKVSEIRMADDDFKANGSKRAHAAEARLRTAAARRVPTAVAAPVDHPVSTATTCLGAIYITSLFSANPRPPPRGCFSSAGIISR
jgi:hypothetical protein